MLTLSCNESFTDKPIRGSETKQLEILNILYEWSTCLTQTISLELHSTYLMEKSYRKNWPTMSARQSNCLVQDGGCTQTAKVRMNI